MAFAEATSFHKTPGLHMDFVEPETYSQANKHHFDFNMLLLDEMKKKCGDFLKSDDVVLDFGCGTGETTTVMANGNIFTNKPKVLGVDVSRDMINYCEREYVFVHSAGFYPLDIENEEMLDNFRRKWDGKISLVTSFGVLHWIPNLPLAIDTFRKLLKPNGEGRVVIQMISTFGDSHIITQVFKLMRIDKKWANTCANLAFPHVGTRYKNTYGWKDPGHSEWKVSTHDLVRLLEFKKFKVEEAKEIHFQLRWPADVIEALIRTKFLPSLDIPDATVKADFVLDFMKYFYEMRAETIDEHCNVNASTKRAFVIAKTVGP